MGGNWHDPKARARRVNPVGRAAGACLGVLILWAAAISCVFTPRFAVDRPATATAEAIFVNSRIKQTVEEADRLSTADAATQQAAATATASAQAAATATAAVRATLAAHATQTAAVQQTQMAQQAATQQASGMLEQVEDLAKKGYLPSASGEYYALDTYTGEMSDLSAFRYRPVGVDPSTFALSTNVSYTLSASPGNATRTSCGFLFWMPDNQDYYQVSVAMDGYIYANAVVKNRFYSLGKSYYAIPKRPGGLYNLTLVVNPQYIYVFYNDKLAHKARVLDNAVTEGKLNFLVTNGVATGFGTRCTFSNVEVWEVK